MKTCFSFPFLVGQLERSGRRQKVSQLQVQDFFVLTKNGIFRALGGLFVRQCPKNPYPALENHAIVSMNAIKPAILPYEKKSQFSY